CVADGMGGHKAGEVASVETIKLISNELQPYIGKDLTAQNIEILMVSAIKNANSLIRKMAAEVPARSGMGTTIVIAYVTEDTAYIANVGDSRAYIVNDTITQLTRDHSLVEDLIEDGTITRDAAKTHPRKHVITRAIGTDDNILADIFEYKYQAGRDTLLLCSDGLTEMLDDNEIFEIVSGSDDVKIAVENLVNKANELGGVDNITVVGLKF
ncbi:MAG: Stp1/IreP family PP2C-type Ser/Thr phosphatase, partial [Oscillospiraceae bacterium]|nr:Stp1/IreP family PP2C-type Ser/Thr phosphatase [Oscillospiraceae bacterium]